MCDFLNCRQSQVDIQPKQNEALSDQARFKWVGCICSIRNDKTLPIQVLQNKPLDHPLGCDAVCSFSALTP